jgi:hypothetical protein
VNTLTSLPSRDGEKVRLRRLKVRLDVHVGLDIDLIVHRRFVIDRCGGWCRVVVVVDLDLPARLPAVEPIKLHLLLLPALTAGSAREDRFHILVRIQLDSGGGVATDAAVRAEISSPFDSDRANWEIVVLVTRE